MDVKDTKLYSFAKRHLRLINRDPEELSLYRNHALLQELITPASWPRIFVFQETVSGCLASLKELRVEAEGWTKLSALARTYFDPVTDHLEGPLIRLQLWAFDDIGLGDLKSDHSSLSALLEYVNNIIKDIMSAAAETRNEMEILEVLVSQGPVEQTREGIESVHDVPGQFFNRKDVTETETLSFLLGRHIQKMWLWNCEIQAAPCHVPS